MTGVNSVVLAGNLTRDPDVRQTSGGTSVATLGLAANDSYTGKDGERVDRTCFVDIETWGRQADSCGQFLRKGAPVLVEGSLQYDHWETEEGEKRSRLKVRASRVHFLGRPGSEGGQRGQNGNGNGNGGHGGPRARGRNGGSRGDGQQGDRKPNF